MGAVSLAVLRTTDLLVEIYLTINLTDYNVHYHWRKLSENHGGHQVLGHSIRGTGLGTGGVAPPAMGILGFCPGNFRNF